MNFDPDNTLTTFRHFIAKNPMSIAATARNPNLWHAYLAKRESYLLRSLAQREEPIIDTDSFLFICAMHTCNGFAKREAAAVRMAAAYERKRLAAIEKEASEEIERIKVAAYREEIRAAIASFKPTEKMTSWHVAIKVAPMILNGTPAADVASIFGRTEASVWQLKRRVMTRIRSAISSAAYAWGCVAGI